jgi:hypothetical protein
VGRGKVKRLSWVSAQQVGLNLAGTAMSCKCSSLACSFSLQLSWSLLGKLPGCDLSSSSWVLQVSCPHFLQVCIGIFSICCPLLPG